MACVILTSCSTSVITKPIERATLDVEVPPPLKLRQIDWKVLKVDSSVYFTLTPKEFEDLSKNAEDVQNRLFLDYNIILKYKEFYEPNTLDK